jgi:hypothetical protein
VAENAGLLTRDAREFLLGHVADIGRRYNLGKGRVRTDLAEEIREMYSKASERFLKILNLESRPTDLRPAYRLLLEWVGYGDKELQKVTDWSEENVRHLVDLAKTKKAEAVPEPKPGDKARTVGSADLDAYLARGWKPVAPFGDRFIVASPN